MVIAGAACAVPLCERLGNVPVEVEEPAGADHVRDLVAVHEHSPVLCLELLELVERGLRSLVVGEVRERLLVAAIRGPVGPAILDLRVVGLELGGDSGRRPCRHRNEIGDVGDLLVAQLASERRHADPAVLHLARHAVRRGPGLVEVRPDCAFRACLLKRVTATAPRAGKDLGAGGVRGRSGAGDRLLTSAAACDDEDDAAWRGQRSESGSVPASATLNRTKGKRRPCRVSSLDDAQCAACLPPTP